MCTEEFIWYQSPEIWAAVISWLGVVVSGVFGWLFFGRKQRILAKFQKELTDHEASLNTKLELLRIKEAQAHTAKLEAIKVVYVKLFEISEYTKLLNMQLRPSNLGTDDEIGERMFEKFKEFNAEWIPNKLFFSKEHADTIENFISKCFNNGHMNILTKKTAVTASFIQQELTQLRKEAETELPAILKMIESNFRGIICADEKEK